MIDEVSEEKQPLIKREMPKRDKVKEKRVDMETCDKVEGLPAPQVKEDVVRVGRLDITDHAKTRRESVTQKIHQMVNSFL